jgi:hypothetical protein
VQSFKALSGIDRRQFITRLMPACVLTCLGVKNALGFEIPG